MRTTPVAIVFGDAGREATMDAARRVSLLTHGDPAAGEGCAIFAELVRVALEGGDPLAAVAPTLALVDERLRQRFEQVLDEAWQPDGIEANGAVWGALGTAVWALRQASSFAEAVVRAIDTGDDADTVGCITGGLAGAVFGIGGIPSRWSSPIHGSLIGPASSGYDLASLRDLAAELAGLDPDTPPEEPTWSARGPHLVDVRGLWVADREGASRSHEVVPNAHVISLSKVAHVPSQPHWRRTYLVDSEDPDENLALEQVLDDVLSTVKACIEAGDPVIVHCYAGESRTGLVLRAWLMERDGLTEAEATAAARELWPHIKTWNTVFTDLLRRRERSGTVPAEVGNDQLVLHGSRADAGAGRRRCDSSPCVRRTSESRVVSDDGRLLRVVDGGCVRGDARPAAHTFGQLRPGRRATPAATGICRVTVGLRATPTGLPPPPPGYGAPPPGYGGSVYGAALPPMTVFGQMASPWWKRAVALIIDSLVLAVPLNLLTALLGGFEARTVDGETQFNVEGPGFVISIVVAILYYTLLNGGPKGQTVGKMALRIQVRDIDTGGAIGYGRGLGRQLVIYVFALACGIGLLLDYLSPLWDKKRQAWHDKVVRSVVVDVK